MSDDKQKINIPEDFPGTGNGGAAKSSSDVDKDPEVLAEVKKNKLLHLKLERWKETAGAVGVMLQTFKAEAVSLMSGLGTLVLGWFQIKKWVVQDRADVKPESLEAPALKPTPRVGVGTGYGSGHGRLGGSHRVERTGAEPRKLERLSDKLERVGAAPAGAIEMATRRLQTPLSDPMNYVPLLTLVVFVWSSISAWAKRKKKQLENGGK